MTRLLIIAALFCLAVPAALAVPPASQSQSGQAATPSASELCKQQRRTIGMAAFRELYAPAAGNPKAAMDACLTKQVQTASTAAKNAAMECKAERGTTADSIAAFELQYGTNANKNAFGKCVSGKSTEAVEAQQDETISAAKKCKSMRASNRAGFDAAYGTKKNAFGKCVAKEKQGS